MLLKKSIPEQGPCKFREGKPLLAPSGRNRPNSASMADPDSSQRNTLGWPIGLHYVAQAGKAPPLQKSFRGRSNPFSCWTLAAPLELDIRLCASRYPRAVVPRDSCLPHSLRSVRHPSSRCLPRARRSLPLPSVATHPSPRLVTIRSRWPLRVAARSAWRLRLCIRPVRHWCMHASAERSPFPCACPRLPPTKGIVPYVGKAPPLG